MEWIGFVVGWEDGGNGRRVESGNWDWYVKMQKIVYLLLKKIK